MSAHDRYLAGYRRSAVMARCTACGEEWDADYIEENGIGWLEPGEDCPMCGASGDEIVTDALSDLDIAERKAEARGEDF